MIFDLSALTDDSTVAQGLAVTRIIGVAGTRCSSPGTSEGDHVGNVLAKLGARDRTQAVIRAYESGFVKPAE